MKLIDLVVIPVLALGFVWLIARYLDWSRKRHIVHVQTGEQIPARSFIGGTLELMRTVFSSKPFDPVETAVRRAAELGRTHGFWVGPAFLVIVTEPEDVKRVLFDRDTFVRHNPFAHNKMVMRIFGESLVSATGEQWKIQRRAMDPAFKYSKLKALVPTFNQCALKLTDIWAQQIAQKGEGCAIPVEAGLTRMTLDAMGLAVFSYDLKAMDMDGSLNSILRDYDMVTSSLIQPAKLFFPILAKLPTKYNRALDKAFANVDKLLYEIIDARRKRGPKDPQDADQDVLDHILEMADNKGQMSTKALRDNMLMFFIAGHDTSTSTLTSALYFLSREPAVQQRAYECVRDVVGDAKRVTFDDINKLEYVSMVIKETLRMRPPVGSTTARTCVKDGVTLGGYSIPKGQRCSPNFFALHYNEKVWPDPYKFDPERFSGRNKQNENAWFPFSGGPHVCLGKKFAMMEMVIALSLILQRFRFEPLPDYQWRYVKLSLSLKPVDELPLKVYLR